MEYVPKQSHTICESRKTKNVQQEGHYKTILNNVYYLNMHM